MMIRIQHPNGRFDMVKVFRLEQLINSGQVIRFKRERGWVTLGNEPVRGQGQTAIYRGVEKRHSERIQSHLQAI